MTKSKQRPEHDLLELEEQLYEAVAKEISDGRIRQGLWLKAFADSDGDKDLARAQYAKLRVEQLLRELQKEIEEERIPTPDEIRKALKKGFFRKKLRL